MRRFEHAANGRFWSIDIAHDSLSICWGKLGTAGQQRRIVAPKDEARLKARELIATQVGLGYVEVFDATAIIASIEDGKRWYRRFEGNDRMVAVAVDAARVFEWRGALGDREIPELRTHHEKSFDKAKTLAAELLKAALGEGMALVTDEEPRIDVEARGVGTIEVATNPELEAQCRANPDHPDPWAVYADWLMERGYLRGELAALRARGKELEADALLAANALALFGDHEGLVSAVKLTGYRYGFPAAATLNISDDYAADLAELTAQFVELPFAMFVDALRFGLAGNESNNDWGPTLHAVSRSLLGDEIRVLRFDDYTYEDRE